MAEAGDYVFRRDRVSHSSGTEGACVGTLVRETDADEPFRSTEAVPVVLVCLAPR